VESLATPNDGNKREIESVRTIIGIASLVSLALVWGLLMPSGAAQDQKTSSRERDKPQYRGIIGPKSLKIKRVDGKTFLSASRDPEIPNAQWYDFTGSVIPPEELQFGIGKDTIPAIDEPVFVAPDDPRLLKFGHSPYRKGERPKANDQIQVVGYVHGDQARAYPIALLNHHEFVNVDVGGKPVTVGW
jgi:hypothetical protein